MDRKVAAKRVNSFNDGAASVNEYTQLHNKYICRAVFVKFQLKLLGHNFINVH